MMVAPYASVAARLMAGASRGMTTVTRTPNNFPARAMPCSWLPEENAMMPRAFSSSLRRDRALNAPRNLNAPARWKFSHFRKTSAPASSLSARDVRMGVTWAWPRRRSRAAWISSNIYYLLGHDLDGVGHGNEGGFDRGG